MMPEWLPDLIVFLLLLMTWVLLAFGCDCG